MLQDSGERVVRYGVLMRVLDALSAKFFAVRDREVVVDLCLALVYHRSHGEKFACGTGLEDVGNGLVSAVLCVGRARVVRIVRGVVRERENVAGLRIDDHGRTAAAPKILDTLRKDFLGAVLKVSIDRELDAFTVDRFFFMDLSRGNELAARTTLVLAFAVGPSQNLVE